MPALNITAAVMRLPPETVDTTDTLSSRCSEARRRRTPRWKTAARIPPPESAKPIQGETASDAVSGDASSVSAVRPRTDRPRSEAAAASADYLDQIFISKYHVQPIGRPPKSSSAPRQPAVPSPPRLNIRWQFRPARCATEFIRDRYMYEMPKDLAIGNCRSIGMPIPDRWLGGRACADAKSLRDPRRRARTNLAQGAFQ